MATPRTPDKKPIGPDGVCLFPDGDEHHGRCGTLTTYTHWRCRGEACVEANREYYVDIRPKKQAEKGKLCSLDWCERPVFARDLCHSCYERIRRRAHRDGLGMEGALKVDAERGLARKYLGSTKGMSRTRILLIIAAVVATVLIAAACTPAQMQIINVHQKQAGNDQLTAAEAEALYCLHGTDAAVRYFGMTKWLRIIAAGDGTLPDCPEPEPPPVPIHEQWPWKQLAFCESGGNWHIATGNGYWGGLQFHLTSWRGVGGPGYPHHHPPATQIHYAIKLQRIQGWNAWPSCARQIGLL